MFLLEVGFIFLKSLGFLGVGGISGSFWSCQEGQENLSRVSSLLSAADGPASCPLLLPCSVVTLLNLGTRGSDFSFCTETCKWWSKSCLHTPFLLPTVLPEACRTLSGICPWRILFFFGDPGWSLLLLSFKIVVFTCKWVWVNSGT